VNDVIEVQQDAEIQYCKLDKLGGPRNMLVSLPGDIRSIMTPVISFLNVIPVPDFLRMRVRWD
jgi:hypothetical protein